MSGRGSTKALSISGLDFSRVMEKAKREAGEVRAMGRGWSCLQGCCSHDKGELGT